MSNKTSIPKGKYYAPDKSGILTLDNTTTYNGIFTKDVNGKSFSDEDLLEFYQKLVQPNEK